MIKTRGRRWRQLGRRTAHSRPRRRRCRRWGRKQTNNDIEYRQLPVSAANCCCCSSRELTNLLPLYFYTFSGSLFREFCIGQSTLDLVLVGLFVTLSQNMRKRTWWASMTKILSVRTYGIGNDGLFGPKSLAVSLFVAWKTNCERDQRNYKQTKFLFAQTCWSNKS